MIGEVREAGLYVAGLALGIPNAVRHRLRGYRTPRRFSSDDYSKAAPYDHKVVRRWEDYGATFAGQRVLELGPGPDLGTGAIMMARGAMSFMAVDLFPLASDVPDSFYEDLGSSAASLSYLQQEYPSLPDLRGPVDLVVSNASLEHIDDVPAVFHRLAEVIPRGGRMVHYIDAKTHTRWLVDHDPLNVFRYSPDLYGLMRFPGMLNRLLADDYVQAAQSAGFEAYVAPGKTASPEYIARTRVAKPYRDRRDRNLLSFALIATRL